MDGNKLQAVKDKQYAEDILLATMLVYEWRKLKPENDELKALSMSLVDIKKYVDGLLTDINALKSMIDED